MEVVQDSIFELMNEELVGSWKRYVMSLVGHCLSAHQSFGLMGLRHPSACTMRLLLNKTGSVRVGYLMPVNPNKSMMKNGLSGGLVPRASIRKYPSAGCFYRPVGVPNRSVCTYSVQAGGNAKPYEQ